ncbi:MAG: hypothetical protein Q9221_007055 [Calogaya cf. arnoldii]
MCILRRFDYPCDHFYGDLLEYCLDFKRLPKTEQEERRKWNPHRCPKGPVGVEVVKRAGKKEDFRAAVDRATKSLNKSLESVHLDKILQLPSAGGCQSCHKAREVSLLVTRSKWDKIRRLVEIKGNHEAAFLLGKDAPDQEAQRESAQRMADHIGGKTQLGTHVLNNPFGYTLPMILLSLPAAGENHGDGVDLENGAGEGSAEGSAE